MYRENSAGADVNLQLFARRHGGDYVMRSEKRGGYGTASNSPNRPKKKRKKAGVFYIAFTFLFSIILWPLGMIMLWQRKVRFRAMSKLLTSIITLVLCGCLCIGALTIQTGNPDITRTQDNVNDFLDHAADNIGSVYQTICDRAVVAADTAKDLSDALVRTSLSKAADSLDFALQTKDDVTALVAKFTQSDSDETEVPTLATAEPTVEATLEVTAEPEITPEATEISATPEATESGETTQAPTEVPTEAPTEAPTEEPTVAPTAVVSAELEPKDAGEAVVYYKKGGKRYHMSANCSGMNGAPAGTLSEAVAAGYKSCSKCSSPDSDILDKKDVVWADENHLFHLSDECSNFTGDWTLMTLADVLENDYSPCTTCKAGLYMATRTQGSSASVEPTNTPETTETPEPTPTATPEPETVTPEYALKEAGEAIVYHSSTGKWYHRYSVCKGMSGADSYPLSEVADGYKWCSRCEPPKPEYVNEHCLWQDGNGLCHTTDECPKFEGDYTLIPRDEALEQGLTGCEQCGANEYLIPNTVIDYSIANR